MGSGLFSGLLGPPTKSDNRVRARSFILKPINFSYTFNLYRMHCRCLHVRVDDNFREPAVVGSLEDTSQMVMRRGMVDIAI